MLVIQVAFRFLIDNAFVQDVGPSIAILDGSAAALAFSVLRPCAITW
jgi:hypothetical protein